MYIDVELDLKEYLGIASSENADDGLLLHLAQRAQGIVDDYAGRTFEASSNTVRYFDPTIDVQGRSLFLDADLCAINTVTNGDGTVISASNYVTQPRNITPYHIIVLKSSANVSWTYTDSPENAIAISGKWAYSLTPPQAVRMATLKVAFYLYKQKDSGADADRAVFAGPGTILPASLPRDIKQLLEAYRRLS